MLKLLSPLKFHSLISIGGACQDWSYKKALNNLISVGADVFVWSLLLPLKFHSLIIVGDACQDRSYKKALNNLISVGADVCVVLALTIEIPQLDQYW